MIMSHHTNAPVGHLSGVRCVYTFMVIHLQYNTCGLSLLFHQYYLLTQSEKRLWWSKLLKIIFIVPGYYCKPTDKLKICTEQESETIGLWLRKYL
jgi:hypothetical protein